jgi:hypothetical protein
MSQKTFEFLNASVDCVRNNLVIAVFSRQFLFCTGNKRKLSVGIALLADSSVIFLVRIP